MAPARCQSRWSGACSRRSRPQCGRVAAIRPSISCAWAVALSGLAFGGQVVALLCSDSCAGVVPSPSASSERAAPQGGSLLALPRRRWGGRWTAPELLLTTTDPARCTPSMRAALPRQSPSPSAVANPAREIPPRPNYSVKSIQCTDDAQAQHPCGSDRLTLRVCRAVSHRATWTWSSHLRASGRYRR
jgi:hypothetical protein